MQEIEQPPKTPETPVFGSKDHLIDDIGLGLEPEEVEESQNRDPSSFSSPQKFFEDLATLPNIMSLAGVALVRSGAKDITEKSGILKIGLGRLVDVADGYVARKINQSSDLGALVDAGLDKLGMLYILKEAFKQKALPRWLFISVASNQMASALLAIVEQASEINTEKRPSKWGKLSMALEMASIASILYLNTTDQKSVFLDKMAKILAVGSQVMRWVAVVKYAKDNPIFKSNQTNRLKEADQESTA